MSKVQTPLDSDSVALNGVIFTHKDIFSVVDDFYTRIQKDPQLQIPFGSVHDWPEHIQRLTHFWWTRFGGTPYLDTQYNPPAKHYFAGFNEELLKQWLKLFGETLKDHLSAAQIEIWQLVTERMGQGLSAKNDYLVRTYGPPQKP